MTTESFCIRPAVESDVTLILDFVRAIADYEKLSHEVTAREEDLREAMFGSKPSAEAALGFLGETPVSFAVYFQNFSTFLGKPGIYLEDVFVKPEYRGRGFGKAHLIHVAGMARDRGCGRLEWSVLNWNEPSIKFYKSLGARPLDEWTTFRLDREAIFKLAEGEPMKF